MPAREGIKLLLKAIEKNNEKQVWEFYLAVYVHLKKKVSFEQFYSEMKAKAKSENKSKQLSKDEIIAMAEEIRIRHLTQSKEKIKVKK